MSEILRIVSSRDPAEKEFHQAVREVFDSVKPVLDRHPEYRRNAILERLIEPERIILFRVPWKDDHGQAHVNRGFQVQPSWPGGQRPVTLEIRTETADGTTAQTRLSVPLDEWVPFAASDERALQVRVSLQR